jgi:hypothetical protein
VTAAALAGAVSAARAALDRRDGPAAALAVEEGLRACSALAARGERLDPAAAAGLAGAVRACLELASAERDRLAGELRTAARSRRAASAYGAGGEPGRNGPS